VIHIDAAGGVARIRMEAGKVQALVDEVIAADALAARAQSAAVALAAIPRASFALTKRAIRRPFLAPLEHDPGLEDEVLAAWLAPETLEAIGGYLQRTFGRSA
jgi:enoyl-CoA hydratase